MFNTKLMEINDYTTHHDSFSSGSDHDDHKSSRNSARRKSTSPSRAISSEYAITVDQKAKAGIFVVDPFHCRINVEFLKAFAQHHQTQPLCVNKKGTYFTSSSEEDEGAVIDLAPDMSHMGFTTSSSSDDEHGTGHHGSFDSWDTPIKPPSTKKTSRNGGSSSPKKSRSSSSNGNSSKIVNSSSLPRLPDNSHKFPLNLSEDAVTKLAAKVNSNYKSFPQSHRHGSTPMDISLCPGIRLLTEDEYIACSLLRIRPALYFHARNTLLHNYYHSVGYFRKSAAQKMLRIDVNKTGKLYDFLVRQNWLPEVEGGDCKPEPEQIIIDDPETYHQL